MGGRGRGGTAGRIARSSEEGGRRTMVAFGRVWLAGSASGPFENRRLDRCRGFVGVRRNGSGTDGGSAAILCDVRFRIRLLQRREVARRDYGSAKGASGEPAGAGTGDCSGRTGEGHTVEDRKGIRP